MYLPLSHKHTLVLEKKQNLPVWFFYMLNFSFPIFCPPSHDATCPTNVFKSMLFAFLKMKPPSSSAVINSKWQCVASPFHKKMHQDHMAWQSAIKQNNFGWKTSTVLFCPSFPSLSLNHFFGQKMQKFHLTIIFLFCSSWQLLPKSGKCVIYVSYPIFGILLGLLKYSVIKIF